MPKITIDYTNTIIYKIYCNNPENKDLYVGHTTNFVQRKHSHKQNCTNSKSPCYNLKLYQMIRSNGGWDNWTMEILNFFKCKNGYEARVKEQEYFTLLGATLNSIEPLSKLKDDITTSKIRTEKKSFYCEKCDVKYSNEKIFNAHINSNKHKMDILSTIQHENPKNPHTIRCEYCHYNTSSKKDFKKHILTKKHKYNEYNQIMVKTSSPHIMVCVCGKTYNHRASLFNHKKTCVMVTGNGKVSDKVLEDIGENTIINDNIVIGDKINITTDMFMKLLNDNQDMIKIIKEQQTQLNTILPKIGNVTNNNLTTNNMNNHFNLNFFLNEKCKDALNISEFIESLKITLEDLQYSRLNGLVEGISNVMIRGLRELDIYKRPIHCTDVKRDTMYIKDDEKWEKDSNNLKMKDTIVKIANKERNAIGDWVELNPDWFDTEAKQLEYLTLINKICEPIENDVKNEKKIIKIIGREIVLDKDSEKLLLKGN
jgi:hypothetical protein|uniref:C2H2-type domain-containing protein n=1 Tax=viral metagenome TaxID=1070528 RepID=A0A6C0EXG4_9ZZZZ